MLFRLEKLLDLLGVLCIAMLFALTLMQVLMRYWYGNTSFFTEEAARFFLVWAAMIGVAIEVRHGGHIGIPFFVERLPERFRRVWIMTGELLVLLLFGLLVWLGVESTVFNHGQESPGLQVPLSIPFAAIPLFFALAAVFGAERLLRHREFIE